MIRDQFLDQYIRLVESSIDECCSTLHEKNFEKKSDFTRVQGKLQGLNEALMLLRSIPEED